MCNIKIHETQPLLNLKLDRVMQDIVYKLVPGLQESEWSVHILSEICTINKALVSIWIRMYAMNSFLITTFT